MKIAVIGGGIQGIGLALELSQRGAQIDLIESREALMLGASRHNEGKIHLGFVYANDASLATARLMGHAAVQFAPIVSRWLEREVDSFATSSPFLYVVHRNSLLEPDELAPRYRVIGDSIRQASRLSGADYFGQSHCHRVRRLSDSELTRTFDPAVIHAAFETAELAIDPDAVADRLVERVLADPNIRVRTGTRVERVRIGSASVWLAVRDEEAWEERYDHVINCAWCGRLAIDATAGIRPAQPWSFRRKYFLRMPGSAFPAHLPSATIVLGGFGDVVRYEAGDGFLSWYPVGCQGLERGLAPSGESNLSDDPQLAENIVRGLSDLVPALRGHEAETARCGQLRNGVIFALGTTDVDDRASELHRRHAVGPRSFGRYHTVDTGKYTTAPLFAWQLANQIAARRMAA